MWRALLLVAVCRGVWLNSSFVSIGANRFVGFSAYVDDRTVNAVRAFGFVPLKKKRPLYCETDPASGCRKAKVLKLLNAEHAVNNTFNPSHISVMVTCKYPSGPPTAVHLSFRRDCLGGVTVPVTPQAGPPGSVDIVSCAFIGKSWDSQLEFVKWAPVMRELGVDLLNIYSTFPPAPSLERYLAAEFGRPDVEVVHFPSHELGHNTTLRIFGKFMAVADCVYRNMRRAKRVLLADIDEYPLPRDTNKKLIDAVREYPLDDELIILELFCPFLGMGTIPPACKNRAPAKTWAGKTLFDPRVVLRPYHHTLTNSQALTYGDIQSRTFRLDQIALFHLRRENYVANPYRNISGHFTNMSSELLTEPPEWLLSRPHIRDRWKLIWNEVGQFRPEAYN